MIIEDKYAPKKKEDAIGVNIAPSLSNVVPEDKLRDIQIQTLNRLKSYIIKTFGPMGSNTKIISGENIKTIKTEYSKDGLKVLKHVQFADPIEASIAEEIVNIAAHVEKIIGDGTTSTVILSAYIFERLNQFMKVNKLLTPFKVISLFNNAVEIIQNKIMERKHDCTSQDFYDIAMISTNGNVDVSTNIKEIYEEFGKDVDISVGISNSENSVVKIYDGLVVDEGMSDYAYRNREDGSCAIRNAHVYYFQDPVDSYDMIGLFQQIIDHNIIDPMKEKRMEDVLPTVICCPRISKDTETILKNLCTLLLQYDQAKALGSKPPILVITNLIASDEYIMKDIADLCGCKPIKKYIDPKMMQKEQEEGTAPTLETIHEFYGKAEEVVSDDSKTKFINPQFMVEDEDGNIVQSEMYNALIQLLETELKSDESEKNTAHRNVVRRRLAALKANIVEYLVGGITISDREAVKDLVEDAIQNCNSAAKNGWGMAANFEGLYATNQLINYKANSALKEFIKEYIWDENTDFFDVIVDIIKIIFTAYELTSKDLYSTVTTNAEEFVVKSLQNKKPFNIANGYIGDNVNDVSESSTKKNVKCSIQLDCEVLNSIAKIISLMVTSNQCLIQAPHLNKYQ